MKRAPKRVIDAAARLAAYAVSCHEELVRRGEHAPGLPPSVAAMAHELGVETAFLVARGNHLFGVRFVDAERCGHSACSQNYIDTGNTSCVAEARCADCTHLGVQHDDRGDCRECTTCMGWTA